MIPRGLAAVLDSPEEAEKGLELDRADALLAIKASGLHPELTR
jgi:hypothetical protein